MATLSRLGGNSGSLSQRMFGSQDRLLGFGDVFRRALVAGPFVLFLRWGLDALQDLHRTGLGRVRGAGDEQGRGDNVQAAAPAWREHLGSFAVVAGRRLLSLRRLDAGNEDCRLALG